MSDFLTNNFQNYHVRKSDNTYKVTAGKSNFTDHSRIRWYTKTFWSINFRTFSCRGVHNVSVGMKTEDYAWICYATKRMVLSVLTINGNQILLMNILDVHKVGTPSPGKTIENNCNEVR